MRNLLALLGAAALTFAAAGWYLGWYKLQPALSTTPGHQTFNVDVDGHKVNADLHKGEQEVKQALDRAVEATTAKGTAPLKTQ